MTPGDAFHPSVIDELRTARERLVALDDDAVVDGIVAALDTWRLGGLDAVVGELGGPAPDMVRFGLERMLRAHDRSGLTRWLSDARAEVLRHSPGVEPGAGPPVVLQILAGNLPGLAVPAAIEALLARSAVLLKPAAGDSVTAVRFGEALSRAAPALAGAVRVARWVGGDRSVEDRVFAAVDAVVATGDAASIDSVSARTSVPVLTYGPRFTVGVIGKGTRDDGFWEEVVREIALWDQKGCLSARILFTEESPAAVAERVAAALRVWEARWPAGERPAGESAAVHAWRTRHEMMDPATTGLMDPGTPAWTVTWDGAPSLETGPAARAVRVTPLPAAERWRAMLEAGRDRLQGVGHAGIEGAHLEGAAGVGRIAPLGSIQDPPAGWRADGRSGLAELLRFGSRS